MKLHYQGKYNLDPETLPKRKHQPNAVKFKEVSSSKELAVIANTIGLVLMVILSIPILLVYKNDLLLYFDDVMLVFIFPILTMFPHMPFVLKKTFIFIQILNKEWFLF